MKIWLLLLFAVFLLFGQSCKKEEQISANTLTIQISYAVDSLELLLDSIQYKNEAGYYLGVSKLEYYISNIRLAGANGTEVLFSESNYVNILHPATNKIELAGIPPGEYSQLIFNIGLIPEINKTGALPNTIENHQMAWPDPMGGGYHFMKLEGRYKTANEPLKKGFALHLGKNENLVEVRLIVPPGYVKPVTGNQIHLEMNIAEWFRNPYPIDFEKDGRYSMSEDGFMHKIAINGKSVFRLKER